MPSRGAEAVMAVKDTTIFNDMFNLCPPWDATLSFYSTQSRFLCFTIDYKGSEIRCPICSAQCKVFGKKIFTWYTRRFYDFKVNMTVYVPITKLHANNCKFCTDKYVQCNTLLMDIIIRQLKFSQSTNPFIYLFNAIEVTQHQ